MILQYSKGFLRKLRKLSKENQERVYFALKIFESNPFHPALHNHALKGSHQGVRSISAGYDLRILFTKQGALIALLINVGKHDDVY